MSNPKQGFDEKEGVYPIKNSSDAIAGASPKMREAYNIIDRLASNKDQSVATLLMGETGVGKDLVARAIHYNSEASEKPFITVNCATLPELLGNELYSNGAFSGSREDIIYFFEKANGGTLYLDKISEMPLPSQLRLLKVLEERKIKAVGSDRETDVDVRIIASTSRDIPKRAKDGMFRDDLYYRLNTVIIHLPPLRERKEDIPLLFHYFLKKYNEEQNKKIDIKNKDELYVHLNSYDWPGNVRELENMVKRAILLSNDAIRKEDVISCLETEKILTMQTEDSGLFNRFKTGELTFKEYSQKSTEDVEKKAIVYTIQHSRTQKEAAKKLGINHKTLYNIMKRRCIDWRNSQRQFKND